MFRHPFAIFLFTALAGLASFSVLDAVHSEDKGFIAIDPPRPVPAFVFEDEKGRTLTLNDFRGKYLLLNLWATSCAPCVAEMPKLNALSKKLDGKKFAVIALSEDHDGRAVVRGFFDRHNIDHLPVYNDTSGRAPFVLRTRGIPTTLLIDPQGAEIARLEGPADWTQDTIVSFLETRAKP